MLTPSVAMLVLLTLLGALLFASSIYEVAMAAVRLIAADDVTFGSFLPAYGRALVAMTGGAGLLLVGLSDLVFALTGAPVRFGSGL